MKRKAKKAAKKERHLTPAELKKISAGVQAAVASNRVLRATELESAYQRVKGDVRGFDL